MFRPNSQSKLIACISRTNMAPIATHAKLGFNATGRVAKQYALDANS